MTRQQVQARMEEMLKLMRREQELRVELLALDFTTLDRRRLQRNLERQAKLIAEVRELRQEKMVPIVRELASHIRNKLRRRQKAAA